MRLYWRIVARFAGDMAVTFVATGGVTLSGGVLPRVVDFLDEAAFRQAFEDKAPVDGLAKRIADPAHHPFEKRCWSAWRRSPPRPIATPSTMRGRGWVRPGRERRCGSPRFRRYS